MCKVRSSSLLIFRHPVPLVRFQAIEWRHKNTRRTLLSWPPSSLLEWTYFMDVPKELNSKNFKKIFHFPTLKETQPTIFWLIGVFMCGIFQGYFTWPCTDTCLKGDNLRQWCGSICCFLSTRIKCEEQKKMQYGKILDVSYGGS